MSYTELFKVPSKGEIEEAKEFRNSWLGAMWIWRNLYEKHLPGEDFSMAFVREQLTPLWNLWKTDIPEHHKVCLMSTLDGVMVKRDNLPLLVNAFREFEKEFPGSHLGLQADYIETNLIDDVDYFAVCWNQNSVCDYWCVEDKKEEDGQRRYDISRDTGHWFLFDVLSNVSQESFPGEL
jgi:hypothetical protein